LRLVATVLGGAIVAAALAGCAGFSRPAPSLSGGSAAPPAPRVVAGEMDARALLGDLPARAARLGAGAPSLVTAAEAVDGEWIGGFVDVPAPDCLLGYARGASSIEDVDAAVYSDEGTQLAVDEGRDIHPTVLLCPPHPDRVYVAAHVVDGEGLVVVGAQLVPRERALALARALGARGSVADGPRPAEAWPGLDDAVRVHRLELGGSWEEFKRVALSVDARLSTYVAFPIEADQCVDAVIVPDDDIGLLDVEAIDGEGRVLARAREGPGPRWLTVCSPSAMPGTLAVRPHVGRGLAAVVLARAHGEVARDLSARPEIAWAAAQQPVAAARRALDTLLAKSGYRDPVASTAGTLTLGRRVSVPLDFKTLGGACARVDVVAGAPLGLLEASVWDDGGALLASGEGSTSLALFACSRGAARLELETRGRPGPFVVTVRPEPWRDGAFAAHPLAASRMLARSAVGPDTLLEGKRSPARDVSLDGAHELSWTESVAPGRCLRVTAGAQGDGTGLDLRASSPVDAADLDRSQAAHAVSVRACAAAEVARSVHFELRASAGRLDAVIGEQVSGKD
jgi:hypothetical protein